MISRPDWIGPSFTSSYLSLSSKPLTRRFQGSLVICDLIPSEKISEEKETLALILQVPMRKWISIFGDGVPALSPHHLLSLNNMFLRMNVNSDALEALFLAEFLVLMICYHAYALFSKC